MSASQGMPHEGEILRLMEEGFFDRTVRLLRRDHPAVAAQVEDVVSDSVLRLVLRPDTLPPVEDVAGYLFASARNGILDAQSRQQRLARYEDEFEGAETEAADYDLMQKEAFRELQQIARRFPNQNMREITLLYLDSLYYREPLTGAQAAERLREITGEDISEGSIGTWKMRGFAQLAQDYQAQRRADRGDSDDDRTDR